MTTTSPWTYTLTNGTFTLTAAMGFTKFSALLISGSATYLGGGTNGAGTAATSVAMQTGIAMTDFATGSSALSGIVITASSGVVIIMAQQ